MFDFPHQAFLERTVQPLTISEREEVHLQRIRAELGRYRRERFGSALRRRTNRRPSRWNPREDRGVSIDHAAEALNQSRRTIYYWIKAGRLQTVTGARGMRVFLPAT